MKNRETLWPGAALVGALILGLIARMLPPAWWLAPWALSLIFFGLPHGALDHEVLLRLWRPVPPPPWALGAVLTGYIAVSLLVLGGWFVAPAAVFAGFIALTWMHWGLAAGACSCSVFPASCWRDWRGGGCAGCRGPKR